MPRFPFLTEAQDPVTKALRVVGTDGALAPSTFTPRGYEQITDLSAAEALSVPEGARFAVIQAEGESVRWRDDGTDPTDSVAVLLPADSDIEVVAGAILNVSYYG